MQHGTKPILGDREQLLTHLEEALYKASRVKIIVSFLMESGVMLLHDVLADLVLNLGGCNISHFIVEKVKKGGS